MQYKDPNVGAKVENHPGQEKQESDDEEQDDEEAEGNMPQFARRKKYNKKTGLENTKDSRITRQNKMKKPDLSIQSAADHHEA